MKAIKKTSYRGGGYADIPLILSAKNSVFMCSSGNRPDELGHRYSDEYRMADFSDRDAILSLANFEISPSVLL